MDVKVDAVVTAKVAVNLVAYNHVTALALVVVPAPHTLKESME